MALVERRQNDLKNQSFEQRLAAAVARFTGIMRCVYLHLIFVASWIVINRGWTPVPKFDSSFVILAMIASVEAIFLSTFVLITQNRLAADADRRADLDLQISLLAEHEITRLVQLVAAIGERIGIAEAKNPDLEPLKKDVVPAEVLDRMDAIDRAEKNH